MAPGTWGTFTCGVFCIVLQVVLALRLSFGENAQRFCGTKLGAWNSRESPAAAATELKTDSRARRDNPPPYNRLYNL
eukprot:10577159-Heterocapsa_arctica.AAC.1